MPALTVAIVGSADAGRLADYNPAIREPEKAHSVARNVGRELARAGCRIVVYSSGDDQGSKFIESSVVEGFVAANPGADKAIEIRYASDQEPGRFPGEEENPKLFERRPDGSGHWEVSFYRSLLDVDGMILLGGGKSTLIAGQIAIGARVPLMALGGFGGAAETVWKTLTVGVDLPDRKETELMGVSSGENWACAIVEGLLAQANRRGTIQPRGAQPIAIAAAVLVALALAAVALVWEGGLAVWCLCFAPFVAGAAGSGARTALEHRGQGKQLRRSVFVALSLGAVAGGMAGLLFAGSQMATSTATGDAVVTQARHLLPIAVGVGFVGGLAMDKVFRRLMGLEVVRDDWFRKGA